jgi:hypothetical protein
LFIYGYPVCDLAFITSQATGIAFVCLKLSMWVSQSDTQLSFCNVLKGGSEKYFRENLIVPELLSDNLSDIPDDIFQ